MDINKLSNFFSFSPNNETATPVKQFRQDTIEYYIHKIQIDLQKGLSPQSSGSLQNFVTFITSKHAAYVQKNEESFFLNELFSVVSLTHLEYNLLLYLTLVSSLTNIDLGDKVAKANRIARDIISIPPDPNPKNFVLLRKILIYLDRILGQASQMIFQPLLKNVTAWVIKPDTQCVIAGYRLLSLICELFNEFIQTMESKLQSIISYSLQIPGPEIRETVNDIITITFMREDPKKPFSFNIFATKIMAQLTKSIWRYFPGSISCAERIIELRSHYIEKFKFSYLPLENLNVKENEGKAATLLLLPFIAITTPELFTDDALKQLFKLLHPMHKKKHELRKEAAFSLGKLIFVLGNNVKKFKKELEYAYSHIKDYVVFPEVVYCIAALTAVEICKFEAFQSFVFTVPLNQITIDAIQKLAKVLPEQTQNLHSRYLYHINTILGNNDASPGDIIIAIKGIKQLEIPCSLIANNFMVSCSRHLFNPSLEVRTHTLEFILRYQNEKPSTEIIYRIFSYMTSEQDEDTRRSVFPRLNMQPLNPDFCVILSTFLHDQCVDVKIGALSFLLKLAKYQAAIDILTQYFQIIMEDIEHGEVNGVNAKLFLILAQFAKDNSSLAQLLEQFASKLISSFLNKRQKQSSSALKLLSLIIPISPESVTISQLVYHIDNGLSVHSSAKRLSSAIDLLIVGLRYTDLNQTIYNEHISLHSHLLAASARPAAKDSHQKILRALMLVGPIKNPNYRLESKSTPLTARYIVQSEETNPMKMILSASVSVVVNLILDVLINDDMFSLHPAAIEVLITIMKVNRIFSDDLSSQLIHTISELFTASHLATASILIANISTIMTVLGDKFAPMIPKSIDLVMEVWGRMDNLHLVRMCEWMFMTVQEPFLTHLHRLCKFFCDKLTTDDLRTTMAILSAFVTFGETVRTVAITIIPAYLKLLRQMVDQEVIMDDALDRFRTVLANSDPKTFFVPVTRMMMEITKIRPSTHDRCCSIIAVIGYDMGECFMLYTQQLSSVFKLRDSSLMNAVLNYFETKTPIPPEVMRQCSRTPSILKKPHTGRGSLSKIEIPQIKENPLPANGADEAAWYSWAQEFFDTIIRNSMSRAISACAVLAEKHSYIKDVIVPIAFLLYYISTDQSDYPMKVITYILTEPNVPQSIIRTMLTALELFEVADIEKPLTAEILTANALKTEMAAIALRSTEYRFNRGDPSSSDLLIDLYTKLGLKLSAQGALTLSKRCKMNINECAAAEKIGLWDEALKLYDQKINEGKTEYIKDKLRCLEALGRYGEMVQYGGEAAATASFHSLDFDKIIQCTKSLNDDSERSSNLILTAALLQNDTAKIEELSEKIIARFTDDLFPLISEDYNLALEKLTYASLVQLIKEAVDYKKLKGLLTHIDRTRRDTIVKKINAIEQTWKTRFSMIPDEAKVLHNFINTILCVVPPNLFEGEISRTAKVSIAEKRYDIAENCIRLLESTVGDANSKLLRGSLLYSKAQKDEATQVILSVAQNESFSNVDRAKAEIVLSKWCEEKKDFKAAIEHAKHSVDLCQDMAEAHDAFSSANSQLFIATNDPNTQIQAFIGVVAALKISKVDSFEYTLKILSTLFRNPNAIDIFRKNMQEIPSHVWLGVIPQILCRANLDDLPSRNIIIDLMIHVGTHHPHVVIYAVLPLLDADGGRKYVAQAIYDWMTVLQPNLTATMSRFSSELVRIAVLWWDKWFTTLDSATAITDDNQLVSTIKDLLDETLKTPETAMEVAFIRSLGSYVHDVDAAFKAFEQNRTYENRSHLWRQLVTIYNLIKQTVSNRTEFDLADASPFLAQGAISLSIPGTYALGKELIQIAKIENNVKIMASKQKPRRVVIVGTNGKRYPFLLKGHEDTRLDERVMQLFKFLNSIVPDQLRVTPYEVLPLTRDVGLIGWVPNCTTLFELVKNYRTMKNINIEEECLESMRGVDYNSLYLDEKVAAFKRGLKKTPGDDLRRILFIHSLDTVHWLDRRQTYTASLASTSIFGYILGLGDRHMSNIMMDAHTAKLVHIDFGDCFEVAQHRRLYPEMVPFRLTRMLVNALEPAGVDGAFRTLCTILMDTCRQNRTKISGLLEAFVYDPLLQWLNNENTAGGVVSRIDSKLSGKDFGFKMTTTQQIDMLIEEATSNKNLCQMFRGWYPWW